MEKISISQTLREAQQALDKKQYNKAFVYFMIASQAKAIIEQRKSKV